jgi:hypothetical protein
MRNFEIINGGKPGAPLRLRTAESGRVLAVLSESEACQLWITLGSALGLGTESLSVKNVARASSLKPLAKRLKKSASK